PAVPQRRLDVIPLAPSATVTALPVLSAAVRKPPNLLCAAKDSPFAEGVSLPSTATTPAFGPDDPGLCGWRSASGAAFGPGHCGCSRQPRGREVPPAIPRLRPRWQRERGFRSVDGRDSDPPRGREAARPPRVAC